MVAGCDAEVGVTGAAGGWTERGGGHRRRRRVQVEGRNRLLVLRTYG